MLVTVASHLLSTAFCACETKRSAFVLKAVSSFFPDKRGQLLSLSPSTFFFSHTADNEMPKFFEVLPPHTLYSLPEDLFHLWRHVFTQ